MTLKPTSTADLSNLLSCANARGEKVDSVDLSALPRVLEHKSEDMTATVEAGAILADVQRELQKRGQWLPIDPPKVEKLSISDLLALNLSGPRRFGYGTVGDYLIGLKVVLADGRLISSGGKVVKNVAGYDLAKLFIGGRGTLGVIVEATFKLRPIPQCEQFVQKTVGSLDEAERLVGAILESELTPVVLDLQSSSVVIGFAGTRVEVEWQLNRARDIGFNEPASLEYEQRFWNESTTVQKISVLPSKVFDTIRGLNGASFVARAGNGVVYYRGALQQSKASPPRNLFERLKNEFDPKHIFPEMPS